MTVPEMWEYMARYAGQVRAGADLRSLLEADMHQSGEAYDAQDLAHERYSFAFFTRVHGALLASGISQRQLAEEAGVEHLRTLERWLVGDRTPALHWYLIIDEAMYNLLGDDEWLD